MQNSTMLFRFVILLALLTGASLCHSQERMVYGTITDSLTGEPVPGAHVLAEGEKGTTSDVTGYYALSLSYESHHIIVSYIGYNSAHVFIGEGSEDSLRTDVRLRSGIELETAVISASLYEQRLSDVSVSMEVIKADYIESLTTRQLDETLNLLPGVDVMDGQANIRNGSGYSYGAGSRVMMLVDGLPMLTGDVNDVKWSFLPVENIGQVEVVKGASSVLYGSSALNGAIHIRTKKAGPKPVTKIEGFSGAYMHPARKELSSWWDRVPLFGGMRGIHSRKSGNTDIVAGVALYGDEGYREEDYIYYGRGTLSLNHRLKGKENIQFGIRGAFQVQRSSDFLIWRDADSGAYLQQGAAITPTRGLRYNIDPYFIAFDKSEGRHSLRTRFYRVSNHFKDDPDKENASGYYYGEYQYYKRFSNGLNLTSGFASSYTDGNSNLYGDHFGSSLAVFLQLDRRFLKKVLLSLGFRWERYSLDNTESDSRPVLRAGLNYEIIPQTNLRASFGQGYRYPSMTEKYTSTSLSGVNIFPNPDLKPENGWSAEAGIRQGFILGSWSGFADIAAFRTEYNDMIEFTFGVYKPDSAPFPTLEHIGFKPVNVGKARIDGVEITTGVVGSLGNMLMTISAGYTYTDPVDPGNDTIPEQILKYRYRHSVKADIRADLSVFSFGVTAVYRSFIERIDAAFEDVILGQQIFPGLKQYRADNDHGNLVVDIRASWQATPASSISVVIRNLLNEEYMGRPGDLGPPLNFSLKYTLDL